MVVNLRKFEFSFVYLEDVGSYICIVNDEMGMLYMMDINVYLDGMLIC